MPVGCECPDAEGTLVPGTHTNLGSEIVSEPYHLLPRGREIFRCCLSRARDGPAAWIYRTSGIFIPT